MSRDRFLNRAYRRLLAAGHQFSWTEISELFRSQNYECAVFGNELATNKIYIHYPAKTDWPGRESPHRIRTITNYAKFKQYAKFPAPRYWNGKLQIVSLLVQNARIGPPIIGSLNELTPFEPSNTTDFIGLALASQLQALLELKGLSTSWLLTQARAFQSIHTRPKSINPESLTMSVHCAGLRMTDLVLADGIITSDLGAYQVSNPDQQALTDFADTIFTLIKRRVSGAW